MKKVFTKMDLRWDYNNVRIKERDEWKAAFTILEEFFRPTVMFFGLMNSLAMFQAMINESLRDLINIGKVAAFIDNVMVGIESKIEHNELLEEILRKMEENDLYVKLEKCKCKWKISEIDFLGVVIRPERIRTEKEKVKAVLDWLVPKLVKDVQKFLKLANYYRRFIKRFAKIARSLHKLTKKKQK